MRTSPYITESNAKAKTAEWLTRVRESTAPRPHLSLEPRRAALLVIDMLRYFAAPDGRCFLPASTVAAAHIASLLAAWRSFGGTIVYTRHAHEGAHDLGMLGRFFDDYIHAGESDSEIIDDLRPQPGEPLLRKTTYDAFIGTPLSDTLEKKGVDQILVTGVLTHMCCETTARSAFCWGFVVYGGAAATASTTEERQLQSLLAMADSVAVIMSSREILERCEKSA
jgi:bifunctional isochorismate lyase/aryl carrier protein